MKPKGNIPSGPRNMRGVMCTKQARAARYEPGAGQAVIESPWLQKRQINVSPLTVSFLKTTGKPTTLARVALPSFRPDEAVKGPPPIPADQAIVSTGNARLPVPTFRPSS